MTARGKRWAAGSALLLALLTLVAAPYATTTAFLLDFADVDSGVRRLLSRPHDVTTRDIRVPTRHDAIPARVYVPVGRRTPAVVVFPGVHGGGVDAPRLARLCHRLGSSGLTVVCVPLPDLREFRITDRSTDMVEDVTRWVTDQPSFTSDGTVTLVGVSFAGGLALVAAGRPALNDRLRTVVSIGGYGDLRRTLRYLATGTLPDGSTRTPHNYALAVVALTVANRLVPADQIAGFERGVRTFLEASLDDSVEQAMAQRLLEDLQSMMPSLPEPSRSLVAAVAARDVVRVGQAVAPFVDEFGGNPALSPTLSPVTTAPVFLLHGTEDNVIPSTEASLMAADLSNRGHVPVRWLLTPLVSHAHLRHDASAHDLWRLVAFWHDVRRHVYRY